jgi:hypothetical protein
MSHDLQNMTDRIMHLTVKLRLISAFARMALKYRGAAAMGTHMPDGLEDLRKIQFTWRISTKDAQSFARSFDDAFPGTLKKFYDAATRCERRRSKKQLLAIIILFSLFLFVVSAVDPHLTMGLVPIIFIGILLLMLSLAVTNAVITFLPDRVYQDEIAEIKKDIPNDIFRNIEALQRRFEIDFGRSPFLVSRRVTYTAGDGGGGAQVGGGG